MDALIAAARLVAAVVGFAPSSNSRLAGIAVKSFFPLYSLEVPAASIRVIVALLTLLNSGSPKEKTAEEATAEDALFA